MDPERPPARWDITITGIVLFLIALYLLHPYYFKDAVTALVEGVAIMCALAFLFLATQAAVIKTVIYIYHKLSSVKVGWPLNKERFQQKVIAALREVKDEEELRQSLFVGFIKNDDDFTYEAHLVNPTNTSFVRVFSLTGASTSDIDSLFETGRSTREKGVLLPDSSLLLEACPREELDWVIWHHLDLYEEGSTYPLRVVVYFPKGSWPYTVTRLPVLDRDGMRLELKPRSGHKKIEQEVVGMDMVGGFWTNEELEKRAKNVDTPPL